MNPDVCVFLLRIMLRDTERLQTLVVTGGMDLVFCYGPLQCVEQILHPESDQRDCLAESIYPAARAELSE